MRKKTIVVLMIIFTIFTLCSCSSTQQNSISDNSVDEPVDPSTIKVGVVVKAYNEYFYALLQGCIDMGEELGFESVATLAPISETDTMGQTQIIEDFIAKDVDLLCVCASQPDTIVNALTAACEAGIKVVMMDTDCPNLVHENKVTFIGLDCYQISLEGGREFAKLVPENGNIVIIRGTLGDSGCDLRTQGLTEAFTEAGLNILETQSADFLAEKAVVVMEFFLEKYKDVGIDAVATEVDNMAIGAIQAMKQAGIDPAKVPVLGSGGTKAGVESIAAGDMAMTLDMDPYDLGQQAVLIGWEALNGAEFESYIDTGSEDIITRENYENYLGGYLARAGVEK